MNLERYNKRNHNKIMDPYTGQYEFNQIKKRRHRKLIAIYAVMTVAVISISALCIALVLGYRFDFLHNSVSQGALVQFISQPDNAKVELDGKIQTFTTPGKKNVDAGKHTVKITKAEYRDWQKTVTLKPGELRWLNYARLIPKEIETKTMKNYPKLAQVLPAPDNNWLFALPDASKPEFELVDLRDPKKPVYTAFAIPSEALSHMPGVAETYKLSEWNQGGRFVLVEHTYGDKKEFIRLDRSDPKDIVNITSKFGVTMTAVHFSSENVFYGFDNGNLRKYDLSAGTLSDPIIKDVIDMRLYSESDIAYVRHADGRYRIGVYIDGKNTEVIDYDETAQPLIELSSYYNNRYLVVARNNQLYIYQNVHQKNTDAKKLIATRTYPGGNISWLDISSTGRFVLAGTNRQFMNYDLELAEQSDINLPGVPGLEAVAPQWLDDSNIVSYADNKLRICDFNGENQQVITSSLSEFPVTLSNDGKLLYSVNKSETAVYQLQVTAMTTEKLKTTAGLE